MKDCLSLETPEYLQLAEETDRLRWDSFLEGRITSLWIQVIKPQLRESTLFMKPMCWGKEFIEHLLAITHSQWIFRNSKVHLKKLDGLTEPEHETIFEKMEELMLTDKEQLLPAHRHYLEVDFGQLSEGPAAARQYWIANMESALSASTKV